MQQTGVGKEGRRWFVEKIMELDEELAEIENKLIEKCGNSLLGILAVRRCISRFDNAREFQKLSGLRRGRLEKQKGVTWISRRKV